MLQYDFSHGKLGATHNYASVCNALRGLLLFPLSQVGRLSARMLGCVRRFTRVDSWFPVHNCNLLGLTNTYHRWLWWCYHHNTWWTLVCHCMDGHWCRFILIRDWNFDQCDWTNGCWKRITQHQDLSAERIEITHRLALILILKDDAPPWEQPEVWEQYQRVGWIA